jgi:hypothetical protein
MLYVGEPSVLNLSAAYRRLCELALRCMGEGRREAALCWPLLDPSPTAIPVLLSLADCAASKAIRCGEFDGLAPPVGVRAAIFPYTRTERQAIRHIAIDKGYVADIQLKHQLRLGPTDDPALADFHRTLARVGSLKAAGEGGYDEFQHPSSDELVPTLRLSKPDGNSGLLWRVRTKTDLRRFDRKGSPADDPTKAAFFIFGIHEEDDCTEALQRIKHPLDLVLLDLTRTGLNRLGRDWLRRVQDFVSELAERHPVAGILALTDDPWTYDRVRFEALPPKPKKKQKRVAADGAVVMAQSSDVIDDGAAPPTTFVGPSDFECASFGGSIPELLEAARTLGRRAVDLGDLEALENLRNVASALRQCASLPAPFGALVDFVTAEVGERDAVDRLARFNALSSLLALERSNGALAQLERGKLDEFATRIRTAYGNVQHITPMAPQLGEIVRKLVGRSSRSVVLFRDDMIADFATAAYCADDSLGDVERRLAKRMLYLGDAAVFNDVCGEPMPYLNQVKILVVVAPTRRGLLACLARPWLPEKVIVVADADLLDSCARDAARLSAYPGLEDLKERLQRFVSAATTEVSRVSGTTVNLADPVEPIDDTDLLGIQIVNLAGEPAPGQALVRIELESGDVIVARPGTRLVLQEKGRSVPHFREEEARHTDVGDRVCVIGDAFVAMARPLLNITVHAAEEIRDYHTRVLERFSKLPGSTTTERLGVLVGMMGDVDVTVEKARYWVKLDEEMQKPVQEVIPHAPRDYATFAAFMGALGISATMIERYWIWAVVMQRSLKVRAAMRYHDSYRSILVSPYAALADNPDRVREIRRIRTEAEGFVSEVRSKVIVGGANARV